LCEAKHLQTDGGGKGSSEGKRRSWKRSLTLYTCNK